ncbi:SDR family NAD(P)-dependent oxidoreductase [Oceaniglobus trochenteri]|uniref:SDR family NAD(P)-dependent oxidoreductase n=1 Tax=Oceaniglobus trochenteri TaxID=2763260 RepID=UPI001CFFE9E4|nr:SDR family oxidoreductase [Oceaniglobus trochenteri]
MSALEGRRALVTGAGTHGIGRAIALALAEAGADVALHALVHDDSAEALAEQIRAMGRKAQVIAADFARPEDARAMVRAADEALGGLDILINNAATTLRKPAMETDDDAFQRLLTINLVSQFACAQEAARLMLKRGVEHGRIVMVSSINQDLAVRDQIAYCAAKGGVRQMAKVLALELAETGITVNLIAPGTIVTDLNRELLTDPAFMAKRVDPVPMRRLGQPEDIAQAAVFLAGKAAGYMTGSTIVIDGGVSLS